MPPKPRILIVEDEPGIVDFLEMGLRHAAEACGAFTRVHYEGDRLVGLLCM